MRRAWPNDSYRRNFQKYRDGRLYFGLSPKYNLHRCGKRLIVRYHGAEVPSLWRRSHSGIPSAVRPFGTRAVYRCSVFAPSVLFGCGLRISVAPAFRVGCDFDVRSTTIRVVNADVQHFCLSPCDGSRTYHERQQKADSCEQDHFLPPFINKPLYSLLCNKSMPSKFHLPGTKMSG